MIKRDLHINFTPYHSENYAKRKLKIEVILITVVASFVLLNLYYGVSVVTEKLAQISTFTPIT